MHGMYAVSFVRAEPTEACWIRAPGGATLGPVKETGIVLPLIIAHRGASHDAPENTLASFRLAWARAADGVECDVWATADGHLVCSHDRTTGRTAGTSLDVTRVELAALSALDVGRWKGRRWAGERIPGLRDLLVSRPVGGRVYVEIKDAVACIPILARLMSETGATDGVTVISFSQEVIAAAREELPAAGRLLLHGLDCGNDDVEPLIDAALRVGAGGVDVRSGAQVDATFAAAVRRAGLGLHVWTVNAPDEARRLARLGVDSITTDRPAVIRQALRAR